MTIPNIFQGSQPCPNCGVAVLFGKVFGNEACLNCGYANIFKGFDENGTSLYDSSPGKKFEPGEICPGCSEQTLKTFGRPLIGKICIPCGYAESVLAP